jgi:hypothetical protein
MMRKRQKTNMDKRPRRRAQPARFPFIRKIWEFSGTAVLQQPEIQNGQKRLNTGRNEKVNCFFAETTRKNARRVDGLRAIAYNNKGQYRPKILFRKVDSHQKSIFMIFVNQGCIERLRFSVLLRFSGWPQRERADIQSTAIHESTGQHGQTPAEPGEKGCIDEKDCLEKNRRFVHFVPPCRVAVGQHIRGGLYCSDYAPAPLRG